jgi:hypothetical protein
MRLSDGRYECSYCRAVLDIPLDKAPHVYIRAASGKPNVRVLIVDGCAIHSCEIAALRMRARSA